MTRGTREVLYSLTVERRKERKERELKETRLSVRLKAPSAKSLSTATSKGMHVKDCGDSISNGNTQICTVGLVSSWLFPIITSGGLLILGIISQHGSFLFDDSRPCVRSKR